LPPVINVGPGSPTGVCFGYGAKFPQKYQDAFFICDWSYGKLYAVHMQPSGSTYKAELEEFVTGTPLPLTDVVVNPHDGAMYFTIGGRKTKSGLYRVTWDAKKEDLLQPRFDDGMTAAARKTRLDLEKQHTPKAGYPAVVAAWWELNNADRFIQFAARTALEHQDPKLWAEKALDEKDPVKSIHAILALARVSAPCPEHTKDKKVQGDPKLRGQMLTSLGKIDFAKLTDGEKLDLIRTYHVIFNRFGQPTDEERKAWLAKFSPAFPDKNRFVNGELLQVFVYLQDEKAAPAGMKLLKEAPTQEEQIEYARALRMLKTGWTPELRQEYFKWFVKASGYKGGSSFGNFLKLIRDDAILTLSDDEKVALKDLLAANPATVKLPPEPARPFVKAYKLADLEGALEKGLKGGRNFDSGRKLFAVGK
jgi:hypothetical protein